MVCGHERRWRKAWQYVDEDPTEKSFYKGFLWKNRSLPIYIFLLWNDLGLAETKKKENIVPYSRKKTTLIKRTIRRSLETYREVISFLYSLKNIANCLGFSFKERKRRWSTHVLSSNTYIVVVCVMDLVTPNFHGE